MNYEDRIKAEIKERLKNAPRYHLYCSVCGQYLYTATRFQKYVVHFDCKNQPIRFYNSPSNPPKPTT